MRPKSNESLARAFAALPTDQRAEFLASLTDDEAEALFYDWDFWARPSQREPEGDWFLFFLTGGRGASKTRIGAEFAKSRGLAHPSQRIALVGETYADGRDTMVEGESGMISVLPWRALRGGNQYDAWNRSLGELFLANGTKYKIFSSEKPGQLRGPQHHWVWGDEPAKWHDAHLGDVEDTTWSNLLLGLRLGPHPQVVLTGTPKPVKLLAGDAERAGLLKDPDPRFVVRRLSTYENYENLSPVYRNLIIPRYEGTRLARQEIHGELIEVVEGAIFDYDVIARNRCLPPACEVPQLRRRALAVDPAVTAEKRSDEVGMVVGGEAAGEAYVLADESGRMPVEVWAARAVDLMLTWECSRMVAEVNNGGDLVGAVVKAECEKRGAIARKVRRRKPDGTESGWDWAIDFPDAGWGFLVAGVWAKDSKALRAEPQAIRYRQDRIHHVGVFELMEGEQTTWVPGEESPNRLDALVYLLTDLLGAKVGPFPARTNLRDLMGG